MSTDTISVGQDGLDVTVTYHTELELKGIRRLADPLADVLLTRATENARAGLADVLKSVRR